MPFLERVQSLIEERGITEHKLLTCTGLDKNSLYLWKKRNTIPSGDTIAKIADYFDVSTDYLLERTDVKTVPAAPTTDNPTKDLLDVFNQLNEEGQKELVARAQEMIAGGRYIKTPESTLPTANTSQSPNPKAV